MMQSKYRYNQLMRVGTFIIDHEIMMIQPLKIQIKYLIFNFV